MHDAPDGVEVLGGTVQGKEVKCVGIEQEERAEQRSHMSMAMTLEDETVLLDILVVWTHVGNA